MAGRSLRFHFCISSSILSILAGFSAHRQPLRDELLVLFSTFSKHLFKDRLCLTEFFHPSGAVCWRKSGIELVKPIIFTEPLFLFFLFLLISYLEVRKMFLHKAIDLTDWKAASFAVLKCHGNQAAKKQQQITRKKIMTLK